MGFLSSMLPTIAGAAAVATMGPAALPWVAGGMGALQYARTGDLGKGLMAGLGAYGGGNLGEALAKQGMQDAALKAAAEQAGVAAGDTVGALAPSSEFISNGVVDTAKLSNYGDALTKAGYGGAAPTGMAGLESAGRGISSLFDSGGMGQLAQNLGGASGSIRTGITAAIPLLASQEYSPPAIQGSGPNPYRYKFERGEASPFPQADRGGVEMSYFPNARYVAYAGGGPVEQMSNANAVGANTGFPMANISRGAYATPYQQPISQNVVTGAQDTRVDPTTGEELLAAGGISHLGDYSDGGRLLRGPGDGVSDSIPATIGGRRPARLADGEFVVPARIVSELGNGSTEAGARKLYAMMDRVQKARGKTVGKGRIAKDTRADKHLPA